MPFGSPISTAMPVSTFLPGCRPPRNPCSSLPVNVSSASTVPASRSRPGRTSADRSRCSIAHAVWYEPISRARCRCWAEIPSLAVANSQQAWNQTVSGVRVRSKIVPAVTEVRREQPPHSTRPVGQPPPAGITAGRAGELARPAHSR
jgi:hypothetical protein